MPGLKVLMPTFPNDAKGMIISAIEDENPVIVLEHRWCHYITGEVEDGYIKSDLIHPARIKSGKDFTVVASSFMVIEAIQACEQLQKFDISVDLFDLRVLRPLNLAKIMESVGKTGRLLTIDTGFKTLGLGAEIVSEVVAAKFKELKSAPIRLGLPDHPLPSSVGYLDGLYVDSIKIFQTIAKNLGLNQSNVNEGVEALRISRLKVPLDIPDPSFKGPF
jgi:pyruvate dehydrogenase E1 component beta subunit